MPQHATNTWGQAEGSTGPGLLNTLAQRTLSVFLAQFGRISHQLQTVSNRRITTRHVSLCFARGKVLHQSYIEEHDKRENTCQNCHTEEARMPERTHAGTIPEHMSLLLSMFLRYLLAFGTRVSKTCVPECAFWPILVSNNLYGLSNSPIMTLQQGFQVGLVSGLLSNHPKMTEPSEYTRHWISF